MPFISADGKNTLPSYFTSKTIETNQTSQPRQAASPSITEQPADRVEINQQKTKNTPEATNSANTSPNTPESNAKAPAQATETTAEQAAKEVEKKSLIQRIIEPITNAFKSTYQHIMDLITPTSKQSLEKALSKISLKSDAYLLAHQAHQSAGNIVESAEALRKHNKANAKLEKLTTRYAKLHGAPQAEATSKPEANTKAKNAAESTEKSAAEGIKNAAIDIKPGEAVPTAQQLEETLIKGAQSVGEAVQKFYTETIEPIMQKAIKHRI